MVPEEIEAARPSERKRGLVVREVQCRTILNRTSLGDYSLNCYTGCAHGCIYCYARFMQRFHPHPEPWGGFVDVKVNAVEALIRQLRRLAPGEVFVSSACDGWQPLEAERRLTRCCCELLLQSGFSLNILTKSALILRDLDVFAGRLAAGVRIGVTLTVLDEGLRALWEPGASPTAERLRVLKEARRAGLATSVMFGPLLPFIYDDAASLEALFGKAAELEVERIWVDALNPRPKVWPAVASLLRRRFPGLQEPVRRILFEAGERERYLAELRKRVNAAARACGLGKRLAGCF